MILSTKENISYQSIVLNYVGKNLKKRYGLSDWTKRPLSKKQLLYAEEDVTFLRNVYQKQIIELKKLHRENWIDDEIKFMLNDSRKNSFENSISENNYPLLFKLLNWREEKAQEKKVAPELLISDKIIKSICKKGIGFVRKLRDARNLTDEIYQEFLNYAESITKDFFIEEKNFERISEISLLKALLDIKSEENNIAPIMIASINDLHKFLSGDKNVKFLQGWRNEIFGNFAVALLDGKIKLGIKNNKAVLYV